MRIKKPKSLKRLRPARVLFPLATCSVALVIFSAVVYALAVPGALMGDPSDGNNSIFSSLFSSASADTSNDASMEGQDGTALSGDTSEGGSFTPAALSAAPTLGSAAFDAVNSAVSETISQSGGTVQVVDPGDPPNSSQNQNQNQSQNKDQGQNSQIQPAEQAPVFDAGTEAAFHKYILDLYSQISPYYEAIRKGYNNLYADWAAGKGTLARCGSIDPQYYLITCDNKRIEAQNCSYNGKRITSDSKWYDEYTKVWRLYENLVNASSLLKEFNQGHTQEYAAERLAVYKSSTGYDSPLDEFVQNYSKVRL